MESRSTRTTVTFLRPFRIEGYDDELPPGGYEVITDEDLVPGLSFQAYHRTATYLLVGGGPGREGRTELRPVQPQDLEAALARDEAGADRP